MSVGKLFQSGGAAAANVIMSPKELSVRPTDDQCSSVGRTQSSDAGDSTFSVCVS